MLGNRWLEVKLLVAIGLVIAACAWSHRRGEEINPAYWRCHLQPDHFDGKDLWIPSLKVEDIHENGFFYQSGTFRVRVRGTLPLEIEEGNLVTMTAVFRRDGTLDAKDIQAISPYPGSRLAVNVVSIIAMILVLGYFLRVFRIRWDRLALRQKNG